MSDQEDLSVSKTTASFKRPSAPANLATSGASAPKVRVTELPHPGASLPETPAVTASPLTEHKGGAVPVQVFLPSRFEFYGPEFRQCFVKPMTGFHQSKFYRAAVEKKDVHSANALTSLIGYDALDLTVPDFFFLLYWLRLNSYTKTQLIHNGVCTNKDHLKDVQDKKKTPESLRSVHTISKTWMQQQDLTEDYLDGFEDGVAFLMEQLAPLGLALEVPRMRDTVELHDDLMSDDQNKDNLFEIEFMADRASCIKKADGSPSTLKERIQLVEGLSVDVHDLLDEWRVRVSLYGVKEIIRFKCKECGADVENPVLMSAHSFL